MTFRLKRRAMPKSWPIGRKGSKWILRTAPGPHSLEESLPVALVLRDLLKTANSSREVRKLLREGKVFIDGKVVKDPSRGLGLMDVLSLGAPPSQHYRMLKSRLGKLEIRSIPTEEAKVKLARIRFKHTVPGGKVALTLHDGRNLLVAANTQYRVGDTLRLELPTHKVVSRMALSPGVLAYISGGSHVGEVGHIDRIEVVPSSEPNKVHFKEGFSTIKEYTFVVGETSPAIALLDTVTK
ncbi:MAG: 30S ribosomal protein S4e [Candidatus Thermoplasmatota archaeon]|jgi:small subunit ribosomal protein S4e|nr:30S ribosomal protein S4e [Candidatus Thermoplasmatota archaeon]MCL5984002.1 30S ribosomal protein S4e [Candidatus Thermoplasmatota archaeon]